MSLQESEINELIYKQKLGKFANFMMRGLFVLCVSSVIITIPNVQIIVTAYFFCFLFVSVTALAFYLFNG
jgi:hypothetical protein